MKKTLIAALASLMLAGAISAVSGATTDTPGMIVIVGEGSSPIPLTAAQVNDASGETSLGK